MVKFYATFFSQSDSHMPANMNKFVTTTTTVCCLLVGAILSTICFRRRTTHLLTRYTPKLQFVHISIMNLTLRDTLAITFEETFLFTIFVAFYLLVYGWCTTGDKHVFVLKKKKKFFKLKKKFTKGLQQSISDFILEFHEVRNRLFAGSLLSPTNPLSLRIVKIYSNYKTSHGFELCDYGGIVKIFLATFLLHLQVRERME